MTTEPTDPVAELEQLEVELTAAQDRVAGVRAAVEQAIADGRDTSDLEALKADHEAALTVLKADQKAQLNKMGLNLAGFRKETNSHRKALGIKHTWMEFMTEDEIAEAYKMLAEAGGGETAKRSPFKVRPDFDPKKHLDSKGQKVYALLWRDIQKRFDHFVAPIEHGLDWKKRLFPDGHIDVYHLRLYNEFVNTATAALVRWGDPKALAILRQGARIVFNPLRMATQFSRNSDPSMKVYEVKGAPFFPYWGADYKGDWKTDSSVGTFLRDLDRDLVDGPSAMQEHIFAVNDCGEEQALLKFYLDGQTQILTHIRDVKYKNLPWYAPGHTILHPCEARFERHWFRYQTYGDTDELDAATAYGAQLKANIDFVGTPRGEICVGPHTVRERYLFLGRPEKTMAVGHQDITYIIESIPSAFYSELAGSPFHSKRQLAGYARNVQEVAMYQGVSGLRVAATVGGHGDAKYDGQNVLLLDGKPYPTRSRQNRSAEYEGVHQINRGPCCISSAYATDHPEYEERLWAMLENEDAVKWKRYGPLSGLVFYTDLVS